MKILIINGPNINMIGVREPEIYGNKTYLELCGFLKDKAKDLELDVDIFQSNYEGDIIEKIQQAYNFYDGIIINAAAYTHTSIAILDALKAVNIDTVEVHLSDIAKREDFRKTSYISSYATKVFAGEGFDSYLRALEYFSNKLNSPEK
ncbi:MAG: type II 3-dehydroquinate dehydratase [Clostridiales bacterium]|nr:type II 3-dehydroquinate dehydratase [Clostridiales bacterium]